MRVNINAKDLYSTKQTTKEILLMKDRNIAFPKIDAVWDFFCLLLVLDLLLKIRTISLLTFRLTVYNKHVLQNSLLASISSFLKVKVGRSSIEPISLST